MFTVKTGYNYDFFLAARYLDLTLIFLVMSVIESCVAKIRCLHLDVDVVSRMMCITTKDDSSIVEQFNNLLS